MKKFLAHLYFYILYIILGNFYSNCKERFKFECEKKTKDFQNDLINSYLTSNHFQLNDNKLDHHIANIFEPKELRKAINPGEVQSFYLYNENIYSFVINYLDYDGDGLLVHFYPLDCTIIVMGINEENENNKIKIESISNYEFDSFYSIIKKEELNVTRFKIKILKNKINDYNSNRAFHLIINSFEYINNTNLIIKEKEPILLNFNNNTLNKINLLYNMNIEDYYIYPISIFFYIKERVKFKISVLINESRQKEEYISYTDRIFIDIDSSQKGVSQLKISIEKIEKGKDAIMIAEVTENYLKPTYFRKNMLNFGFIPIGNQYQYYYMDIFKGEEGIIILNNKRYYGKLLSKLIKKERDNDYIIYNISEYPKEDDSSSNKITLEYNEYSQILELDRNKIEDFCEDGCYLLISYFSYYLNYHTSDLDSEEHNTKFIGIEFTLLSIIFEDEENRAQLINIPLNEYIFGIFETQSINIHYFSVYIPDNSSDLEFELHFNRVNVKAAKGIKRFNIFNEDYSFIENSNEEFIENCTPEKFKLEYFGGQYITFAISNYNQFNRYKKYYYFRILQKNPFNDCLIYPLDTNKVNFCKTNEVNGNFSCFFIINNIYKDLDNDLIINTYGNENLSYIVWSLDENDNYYSIDIRNINYRKIYSEFNKTFFKIDKNIYVDSKYILIKIQSPYREKDNLEIIATFYDHMHFISAINIYSYQLIYLNFNENCSFNTFPIGDNEYRLIINNSVGIGEICANDCSLNEYKLKIRGERISLFPIKKKMNNINFYNKKEKSQLVFKVKINYEYNNSLIEEL